MCVSIFDTDNAEEDRHPKQTSPPELYNIFYLHRDMIIIIVIIFLSSD